MTEVAPGQTLDQYEIVDVIARSGMASIFRARDRESGERVVLKVPHMQYEADIVFHQRFRREEEIGHRLSHPGIIKLLRPLRQSRLYLAMEYIEGELLRERLRREGRLPISKAIEIAIQIADILVYLHEHDVVHRDLKPENIMILPDGGVKIMDFGIALDTTQGKITWGGLSQSMGTPDYMAPEQVKGQRGDERTDIYSLGIMLYEMLTGQVPFTSRNVYSALRLKDEADPTPPRFLRPEISPELDEAVLMAIEREPRARPHSALEFREALAHPESVVLTDRVARRRAASRIPRRLRLVMTITGALACFGIMWSALYYLAAWTRR